MKDRFELAVIGGKTYSFPTMRGALEFLEKRPFSAYRLWEDAQGHRVLRLQVGSSTT